MHICEIYSRGKILYQAITVEEFEYMHPDCIHVLDITHRDVHAPSYKVFFLKDDERPVIMFLNRLDEIPLRYDAKLISDEDQLLHIQKYDYQKYDFMDGEPKK